MSHVVDDSSQRGVRDGRLYLALAPCQRDPRQGGEALERWSESFRTEYKFVNDQGEMERCKGKIFLFEKKDELDQ